MCSNVDLPFWQEVWLTLNDDQNFRRFAMVRSYKHAIDFIICIPRKFLANMGFPVFGINESKEQAKEAKEYNPLGTFPEILITRSL